MSVAKTSASWVATVSGMRASSVAANSDERIVPLPMRTCASSGSGRDVGDQLVGDPLDAQPREVGRQLVVVGARVARDQLGQRAVLVGAHLDHLAAAAFEQLAGDRIGAQEGGGAGVGDVQALQQAESAVSLGAGQVGAVQLQLVLGQRVELGLQIDRSDGFVRSFAAAGRPASGAIGAMPKAVTPKPARPSDTAARGCAGSGEAKLPMCAEGRSPGAIKRCRRFQFSRSAVLGSAGAGLVARTSVDLPRAGLH